MEKRLNIPMNVIRQAETKASLESLAMNILFKHHHTSGVILDASIKSVKTILHVGHDKAKKLVNNALESGLFYSWESRGKRHIGAKGLKDRRWKTSSKGNTYKGEVCYTITTTDDTRLADVVRELQDAKIVKCIDDTARIVQRHKLDSIATQITVPYKTLEGKTGLKRSNIYRKIMRMVKDGIMSKTGIGIDVVNLDPLYYEENERKYNGRTIVYVDDFVALLFRPCMYGVLEDMLSRFKHIIYTCKKRMTENQRKFDNPIDAHLAWQM